jgi:retron-type reverse transcriptase
MRRHGDLFREIMSLDNLYEAYKEARKGKRWQWIVRRFEENVLWNIIQLQDDLEAKRFTTSAYRTKRIYEPKERDIYVLPFYPDRIVQHALLRVIIPIWDGLFIYDSYACRAGKGMHQGSRKVMEHIRRYRYCLKCDISKFYPSIDHEILKRIIRKKIKCRDTLWLIDDIIDSFEGGKNTPIGNYTSQWFGNLYMNELDQWLRHTHKVRAYVRYTDDFVIFSDDKRELHRLRDEIEQYLREQLKLKFSKWSIFPVSQGVDYLGYRHFKEKILLRKSTAKRVKKRMAQLPKKLAKGKITTEQYRSSIASTEGWLRWSNSHNLWKSLQIDKLKAKMKGFPEFIQTRHDVEVLLESHPEETKAFLRTCLDEVNQWFDLGPVDPEKGITDKTHKVVEEKGMGEEPPTYRQYELREDPNCKIFRLGFTVEEVRAIVRE